ncbi:hypothetical protein [Rhizobium sp. SGZ-381]|uniref:hypothetical protein n=1 Tax=Rhizobium sp. SGZ-381 TaxID=3342800 RepID=UPI00366BFB25
MTLHHMDETLVRNLAATCDWRDALSLPKALFDYVAGVIDAREPSVYLIDLLPSLTAAMQSFLSGVGAFNMSPLPETEVAIRRSRLVDCLDAFMDEARLSRQSVVFLDTLRSGDRT